MIIIKIIKITINYRNNKYEVLKMDELINKISQINNLSELENIDSINSNTLLYAIVKSRRYHLLENANIKLNLNDNTTLEELIDIMLSDSDIGYYFHRYRFSFSKEELNIMFKIVYQKYQYSDKFDFFLENFFEEKDNLNELIIENEEIFKNYINDCDFVFYRLNHCDKFIELILKGNHINLIGNLDGYSISNLKLLVKVVEKNNKVPYYLGNNSFANHLFRHKSNLEPNEFCTLLNLLVVKDEYDRKPFYNGHILFSKLVNENIDYLIDVVTQSKIFPKCLIESSIFRDECIKRNRIDLAVKCIFSPNIVKNEELIKAYCKKLNIDLKDFYERSKWLIDYYDKNNNIFNTFLGTSLKDNIFNLNEEHYERFINDVGVQVAISKLNDKELLIFSKILNLYNYKDYDISLMIVNIINNISNYKELINSLNIDDFKEEDLRKLVSVLQHTDNQYKISIISDLYNYDILKQQYFINNYNLKDLDANKDNLLKLLFNIDLTEAEYIDYKYCHDNDDNNVLDNLKNSELPSEIYDYLLIINKIVECNNKEYLIELYNNLKDIKLYNSEIPLESYLRGIYTELYSKSLYRIEEKNQIYGPKDSVSKVIDYNGKKIQVCVPRVNFNFFVHCIDSRYLSSDVMEKDYRDAWVNTPQLQDHFVACSYINEKGIYSIFLKNTIILGFDSLENGAILGMGNTDIDSVGYYANAYDGSRILQAGNRNRARFFVPSEIIKTINSNGHNELVVERRNTDKIKNKEFKRVPDYIIMMAESLEQQNFNTLENLYQNQLSFISEEDKNEIKKVYYPNNLKQILVKYQDKISQLADNQAVSLKEMINIYIDLIMKAKHYEDCLKAASEFDIPLVIVDKEYCFKKILIESKMYDDENINKILEFYAEAKELKRAKMFNMVAQGKDVTKLFEEKEIKSISITG